MARRPPRSGAAGTLEAGGGGPVGFGIRLRELSGGASRLLLSGRPTGQELIRRLGRGLPAERLACLGVVALAGPSGGATSAIGCQASALTSQPASPASAAPSPQEVSVAAFRALARQ